MSLKKASWLPIACLSTLLSSPTFAQSNESISIPTIDTVNEITIDAVLNEPQWQKATRVNLNIVTRPYDNTPSPIKTEALLMESGDTLYLAFIAQDPEPENIRAYLRDRDKSWGDDIVGIKIDAYNDKRSAYRFLVNALGVQIDGIESEVTNSESDAWDGIWASDGRITETGYVVEMALPLRMLNFNDNLPKQRWGIELMRFYPRDERLRISNIRLERGNNCEICQLATAEGFSGAKQGQNLTITPSIVTARRGERDDNDVWQEESDTQASLDLRWGITPDVLLNATINPDFSTVESDNAQLNINNNFALFNQEKRPFFLDNADYFDSNYNLVYTRNINAPNYGAKLTGRHENHALGVFFTDDDSTNILIPGNRSSSIATIEEESQAAALRYRYSYNDDLTIGWISTLRSGEDYQNMVHGIDARYRASQFDVIKFQHLYSSTEYPEDLYRQFCDSDNEDDCHSSNIQPCALGDCAVTESVLRTQVEDKFSGNAFRFGYYHNDRYWHYKLTYDEQNAGFRGDLGFISRVDNRKFSIGGERKWYAAPGNWWTQAKIYSDYDITKNDQGELIEEEYDISARLNARYESHFRLSFTHRDHIGNRLDKSTLSLTDNVTLFKENIYGLFSEIKPVAGLYLNTSLTYGDAIDFRNNRLGRQKRVRPVINWNVNRHLELKLRHTFRQLDADGANVFSARLTDLRATYQFDVQNSLRFTLIYNNTTRNIDNYPLVDSSDITQNSRNLSAELLYAYKINPQTVFYAGYSTGQYGEQRFSNLEQEQRSLFLKFSYAWIR